MPIQLSDEVRGRLLESIQRYFAEKLDDDIGVLKAGLLLDYCLAELGPCIYNQAITDAQAHLQEKLTDLDGICHEEEFRYWFDQESRPGRS